MLNMQYELAHEREDELQRSAEYAREASRLAAAARWRRIERLIAFAHDRVAKSAQAADELNRVSS
jgi:hypothetical protein